MLSGTRKLGGFHHGNNRALWVRVGLTLEAVERRTPRFSGPAACVPRSRDALGLHYAILHKFCICAGEGDYYQLCLDVTNSDVSKRIHKSRQVLTDTAV